jgi:hypothetical protein
MTLMSLMSCKHKEVWVKYNYVDTGFLIKYKIKFEDADVYTSASSNTYTQVIYDSLDKDFPIQYRPIYPKYNTYDTVSYVFKNINRKPSGCIDFEHPIDCEPYIGKMITRNITRWKKI